jgi:hypothetical protein
MRKISSFVVAAAALIATGFGVWATSTAHGPVPPSMSHRIEPLQLMMNAKGLPTVEFADHTFVFH